MNVEDMFRYTKGRHNWSRDGLRSRSIYWWSQLFQHWDQADRNWLHHDEHEV